MNINSLHIAYNNFVALPINLKNLMKLKDFSIEWFKYTNPAMEVR